MQNVPEIHFVENGYPSLRFPNMVKVNIHDIERELHVSTPYEFLPVHNQHSSNFSGVHGFRSLTVIYSCNSLSHSRLVSMWKIQMNFNFQTRSERLIIIKIKEYIDKPPFWKRSIAWHNNHFNIHILAMNFHFLTRCMMSIFYSIIGCCLGVTILDTRQYDAYLRSLTSTQATL